jgi:hypothetical protein
MTPIILTIGATAGISLAAVCSAQEALGTWKLNPARSAFNADPHPGEIMLRIERHAKGEAVTVDRILDNGRAETTSIILYLNGQPREFQVKGCSGTQSSQRLDGRTVEVRFECRDGRSVRLIRRVSPESRDLVLEVLDQPVGGRQIRSRLVLEKRKP